MSTLVEAIARAIWRLPTHGASEREMALAALKAMKEHGLSDAMIEAADAVIDTIPDGDVSITEVFRAGFAAMLQAAIDEVEAK